MRKLNRLLLGAVAPLVLGAWLGAQTQTTTPNDSEPLPSARPSSTQEDAQASSHDGMVVPQGSEIVVRTNEGIDSTTAQEGKLYSGVVQEAVTDTNGHVLIPKDSDARLTVRKVSTGGTMGSPEVALALDSINIRGRQYTVSTADVQKSGGSGIGKNKRTGEYVGGGAVLGTLLGAIAGGGKGAAIGAVAGAAAGGATQVLTRGKEIKIPAETSLRFRLDQPLDLRVTE